MRNAVEETANSIFGNQGQSCCASSRIYVHEAVHDKYVELLKEVAESRVVGDPFDSNTTNGAIISDAQFKRVMSYIEKGKQIGARVVTGGERLGNKGYFVRPTIFADVKDDMIIARDEVIYIKEELFLFLI